MNTSFLGLALAIALQGSCLAQGRPGPDARDIYRSLASGGENAAGTQALRVGVLRRVAPNEYTEVDPQTAFRSGDRVRLRVENAATGWLYVIQRGSRDTWKLLYAAEKRHLAGQGVQIPPAADFQFDDVPGTETLFVIASSHPIRELDAARTTAAELSPQQGRVFEGEAGRSLRHRSSGGQRDIDSAPVIYAASSDTAQQRAVLEVSLQHR